MTRWIFRPNDPNADSNGLVDASIAQPTDLHNPAVYVIKDEIEPTRHMCDGNYYTSKSEFRKTTKAHGCIEAGDDKSLGEVKPWTLDRNQRRQDLRQVTEMLKQGMHPNNIVETFNKRFDHE